MSKVSSKVVAFSSSELSTSELSPSNSLSEPAQFNQSNDRSNEKINNYNSKAFHPSVKFLPRRDPQPQQQYERIRRTHTNFNRSPERKLIAIVGAVLLVFSIAIMGIVAHQSLYDTESIIANNNTVRNPLKPYEQRNITTTHKWNS